MKGMIICTGELGDLRQGPQTLYNLSKMRASIMRSLGVGDAFHQWYVNTSDDTFTFRIETFTTGEIDNGGQKDK